MQNSIPRSLKKYFWDTDIGNLNLRDNSEYIIERLLELGDIQELNWLNKTYSRDEIIKILQKSRRISPKTGNFYSMYYKIPQESLACMKKRST